MYCKYAENVAIDIDVAKQVVDQRIKFSEGESYPCLIDMRGVISVTKEAREYLAEEGAKLVSTSALITRKPIYQDPCPHFFNRK